MSGLPAFEDDLRTSYTTPPNPGWKIGQKVDATPEGRAWLEGEKAGWKFIDTKEVSPMYVDYLIHEYSDKFTQRSHSSDMYKLFVSGVVPRPIAFVSSEAENGTQNLAPFR